MRIAVHTYSFRDLPTSGALDEIAALGATNVEIWLGHALGSPEALARELKGRGLGAAAVGSGGFYRLDDDTPERAFSLAGAIGAPAVVACVSPILVRQIAGRLPQGVSLCVENHWDQPLARPSEVLAAIDGTGLRACLDTGHALLAGVRPDRFAEELGPALGHVHLKEGRLPTVSERVLGRRLRARLLARPQAVAPGDGELDLVALRRALERVGFEGTISVEHEGARPAAAVADLLRLWNEAG